MESMTFPILVIAIIFLGLALAGAICAGEAKFGMGLLSRERKYQLF
ncbi:MULTISPECIES: hypothetical protein [Providencia]|nr:MULTISPECIES: hypothetical protein [Providencia]UNJ80023.1 hypothetical protein [Providencia sp.]EHZ7765739.1 hypothetical protein [Providencia rettgeri]EIJ7168881.1 hypothetical protein [Providencia rettgeri]EJD6048579.1 hypothetical protein [Providencia rettgeri]EJD6477665.1 hypothetical protein [Providencia rettgeri]